MIDKIKAFDETVLLSLNRFATNFDCGNKFFAEYLIYLIPVILVLLWFWQKKAQKVGLRALFSAILAWPIFALILGKMIDRPRPFASGNVHELLFHRPTYSFPSDHAAAFFSVAMAFYLSGYKKLAYMMFSLAIINSFFRIATGIHWPTDILGGAMIGLVAAYLIYLFDKPLNIVYDWLLKIAHKIKLA